MVKSADTRDPELNYRELFDKAPVPFQSLDQQGRLVEVNHAWLENLGYAKDEVVDRAFEEFLHPDDRQRFSTLFPEFKKQGTIKDHTFRLRHRSGRVLEVEFDGVIATRSDGSFKRTHCVFRDISQRREAERELLRSEARYRTFAEDMPLMVVQMDPERVIRFVNHAVTDFFGGRQDRYRGRPLMSFFPLSVQSRIEQEMAGLNPEKPTVQLELPQKNRDGQQRTIRWIARAIFDESGEMVEYQAIGEDITSRKEVEQQLIRAREDALQASRAKSDFLASMSHEIRTPLNGIIGMAEYLTSLDLPETHAQCVSLINQSGQMLLELINDILDFSKIEAGKLNLFFEPVDLPRELETLMKLLRERAESKRIALTLDHALRHHVFSTDMTRLKQVLLNLIGNAIKFTHRGGCIQVRVEEAENRCLRFSVTDNGIGISPEKRAKLFEPFVQADGSVNKKFGGTGLGLSICKRIVDQMEGNITVDSTEGEGSTFAFIIPCEPIDKVPEPADPATGSTLGGPEVQALIVDDNRHNAMVLDKLLDQLEIDSGIVMNAEDALATLNQGKTRLVFLDLNLPGLSGLELGQNIREGRLASIPDSIYLVAYTASATTTIRARCRDAGFQDFLAKPITMESLQQVIERYQAFEAQKR
jgi:PAS domain S-box-containing protein